MISEEMELGIKNGTLKRLSCSFKNDNEELAIIGLCRKINQQLGTRAVNYTSWISRGEVEITLTLDNPLNTKEVIKSLGQSLFTFRSNGTGGQH